MPPSGWQQSSRTLRRYETPVDVFHLLVKPLLLADGQWSSVEDKSTSTRRSPDFPLHIWLPETIIFGIDLPECTGSTSENEAEHPPPQSAAVWLFTDRNGRLRATRKFTEKEICPSCRADAPCCVVMRDPLPGNTTTTSLTLTELASELNNKAAGKRVIQKLPAITHHQSASSSSSSSSLRITYKTGTCSSRDFGRITAESLLGPGLDSVTLRCPREIESAVRALVAWLLQVRGLRLTAMTLRFARRSSSRRDVTYWLLSINHLHAITSKRRSPQHLTMMQDSRWTARCASEASADEGASTNLSESSEVPSAQTSAYQSYRCGSCSGSFPSLPYRVAAVALYRSGQTLQQLMSSEDHVGPLLPGMCPPSVNPSEDRYRLVHTCGQCYRLHLALEDLAQLAKLFFIKLGGRSLPHPPPISFPGPVIKGQATTEASVDKLSCFVNTLAAESAYEKTRRNTQKMSTPTAVDFLLLDDDLPIPLDHQHEVVTEEDRGERCIGGFDSMIFTKSAAMVENNVLHHGCFRTPPHQHYPPAFNASSKAAANDDDTTTITQALIIRFSFLGTYYKLNTPTSVKDCQADVRALRLFWLFADDANSIQRWARKTKTFEVAITLNCYQDDAVDGGVGKMFELPISLCEISLSGLSAISPQQTSVMLELKTVSRRWCGDLPETSQRFTPPPLLRGWLCMDMPNPSIIDCNSHTTNAPPDLQLRPVKPSTGLWVPKDWMYLGVTSPLPDLWLELLTSYARVGIQRAEATRIVDGPSPVADKQHQWNNGTAAVTLLRLRVHGIRETKLLEEASTGEDMLVGLTLLEARDDTNTILGDWQKWIDEGVKLENIKIEEGIVMTIVPSSKGHSTADLTIKMVIVTTVYDSDDPIEMEASCCLGIEDLLTRLEQEGNPTVTMVQNLPREIYLSFASFASLSEERLPRAFISVDLRFIEPSDKESTARRSHLTRLGDSLAHISWVMGMGNATILREEKDDLSRRRQSLTSLNTVKSNNELKKVWKKYDVLNC